MIWQNDISNVFNFCKLKLRGLMFRIFERFDQIGLHYESKDGRLLYTEWPFDDYIEAYLRAWEIYGLSYRPHLNYQIILKNV